MSRKARPNIPVKLIRRTTPNNLPQNNDYHTNDDQDNDDNNTIAGNRSQTHSVKEDYFHYDKIPYHYDTPKPSPEVISQHTNGAIKRHKVHKQHRRHRHKHRNHSDRKKHRSYKGRTNPVGSGSLIAYSGSATLNIPKGQPGPVSNTYSVGFSGTNGLNLNGSAFGNAEPGDIAFRTPQAGIITDFWYELEGTEQLISLSDITVTTKLLQATPTGSPGTIQPRVAPTATTLTNNTASGLFGLKQVIFDSTSQTISIAQGDIIWLSLTVSMTLQETNENDTNIPFNFHAGFTFI